MTTRLSGEILSVLDDIARHFVVYRGMLDRCANQNHTSYKNYGGRGITVCRRWRKSFAAFMADMGLRPTPKHSLDRIDNDKGYFKDNCRWATKQEQANNQRNTLYLDGKSLSHWAEKTGLKKRTLDSRLRAGWSSNQILNTVPNHGNKHQGFFL